jgi:uncharacterized membrane protein YqjE
MATETHGTDTHRMHEAHEGDTMHEHCDLNERGEMRDETRSRFGGDGRNRQDERTMERQDERSLVGLFKELRDESTYLFRQEVALAKVEMSEKAAKLGRNMAYLVAGLVIAIPAVLYLTLTALVGIYNGLVAADMAHANAGWVAPLIMTAILGVIAAALIIKGLHAIKNEPLVPERTMDSLRDDKNWIKEKVKS